MLKNATILVLALLSAACAQLPRAEFQAYRDAFEAAHKASAPIMENYAVSERVATRDEVRDERHFATYGFFDDFRPDDVIAGSSLGLPPGADAADRAFRAIANYNDALVGLAENRNVDEVRAQLGQLTSNVAGIAPQLAGVEAQIKTTANLLVSAVQLAIQADNREVFKQRVIDGHPQVVALIGVLRRLTPHQYELITASARSRWQDASAADRTAIAQEVNGWHRVFSDYVFLLNAMEARLAQLELAVRQPRSRALLVQAVAGSAELRVYAEGLRRSIVELRATR